MGAWGHGPFENDSACDWAGDFLDQPDKAGTLKSTLTAPIDDLAEDIIAAAEVVAALRHRPCAALSTNIDSYTEKLAAWLKSTKLTVDSNLLKSAHNAVYKVLHESGMSENWAESFEPEPNLWKVETEDLLRRLA